VIVFNDNEEPLDFSVTDNGGAVTSTIAPDSIQTILME